MAESESSHFCEKCKISFKMRKNLNAHIRKFHPEQDVLVKGNQICGMCDVTFRTVVLLQEHLEKQHSVCLKYDSETFYSDEEFLNWKEKIEKESLSSFVLRNHSERKEIGKRLSYYICHRSGYFKPKEERTRHLKTSGSVKSGCTCPAIMNVSKQTVDDIVEINVRYQSVHVGHELETGKLRLTKAEKENLAADLYLGIPMSKILDKTRKNFSSTSRYCLTTRKDLGNICRDFQLREESVYHANDSTSVDILVQKLMNESDDPVLIYKAVGQTLPNYSSIHQEDFLLGLMNDAQEKLLGLYGSSCIMIDSTHGTNQYGFELTTLMVHDENHEGLPVATLFSSRTSSDILLPFFDSIRKRIPNLHIDVLMTDDTNSFLNAWEVSFDAKPTHLLCIWHVNKNINRNINIKVKNSNNRSSIKTEIKDILTEIDVTTFNILIEEFVEKYKEEENSFVQYFETTYKRRAEKWAYCHRKGLGINTNMKLERWHRQIKYEESGGTVMKRLDRSISVVMNAVAKKLLSRLISMERGKLTHKVALIRKRHAASNEMKENYSFVKMDANTYVVTKKVGPSLFTYYVEKTTVTCCCDIKCSQCSVCIYSMSCTCIDYSVKFIICKHIHYVCLNSEKLNEYEPNSESGNEDNLIIDIDEKKEKQIQEKEAIIPCLQKCNEDLDSRKNKIRQQLKELDSIIQGWDKLYPLPDVEDKLKGIKASLQIAIPATSACKQSELPDVPKVPSNKQITKQRKFQIKKKGLRKEKLKQ